MHDEPGISFGADARFAAAPAARWARLAGRGAAALAAASLLPARADAASAGAPHLDGASLGILWVLPFVGILLSIALMPLLVPRFWHHHFGKVSAFWGLAFAAPFALVYGWELALYEVLHTFFLEYLPFIILLTALYTVAGGVRLTGTLRGTPGTNTALLAIGTGIASLMGTTGAAMLLIRPLIRANRNRRHKVHVFVFFIFLVANIGGSLTPLGDPPLFLGFLKGVPFFWPTVHLLGPMLLCAVVLLAVFYALDKVLHRRARRGDPETLEEIEKLGVDGKVNVLLLAAVVGTVLMTGIWQPGTGLTVYHVTIEWQQVVGNLLLILITFLSLRLTTTESRRANEFTWAAMLEVAKLFAAIFATIIPAIAILRAGESGALSAVVSLVNQNGQPVNAMYFWLTGALSSFLDNAPTYLVFFNTAGGDAKVLTTQLAATLAAISAGAVFMGANTYIGNAPNFMVKAICEERGIAMPSFFGYMAWSCGILVPLFVLVTLVFFR
jgi:Na+/H+ antiporter NhaD/arsenite permease-like protein